MISDESAATAQQRSAPADLPVPIHELVQRLAALPGVTAVMLGGSQATGAPTRGSDWDLAVYYREPLDLSALQPYGDVFPPGTWGRLMNGGAWLRVGDHEVDVMLRDLDVVMYWTARATAGEFELDALLGYVAGIPTYSLTAELALGHLLHGVAPPAPAMPDALRVAAPPRWRFSRDFSLEYARMHARRANVAGVLGQAVKATMEEAHARVCERGLWTLNEKQLLSVAELDGVQDLFTAIPRDPGAFGSWLTVLDDALRAT